MSIIQIKLEKNLIIRIKNICLYIKRIIKYTTILLFLY